MSNERERKFKCTSCQEEMTVVMPEGAVVNKPTFSLLMMVHQDAYACPKCGQAYVFILRGVTKMEVGWAPVVIQKEDPDIIIPPVSLIDMNKLKGN